VTPGLEPFQIVVPQSALDDLAERLRRARLPGAPAGAGWSYGIDPAYLARLLDYWRTEFDWRAVEVRLNRLAQFTAPVGGDHRPGRG